MAYTNEDLINIETAILSLARGTRKVELIMGDKKISYGKADLPELRTLRAEIDAELSAATTTRKRYFMFQQTGKGL